MSYIRPSRLVTRSSAVVGRPLRSAPCSFDAHSSSPLILLPSLRLAIFEPGCFSPFLPTSPCRPSRYDPRSSQPQLGRPPHRRAVQSQPSAPRLHRADTRHFVLPYSVCTSRAHSPCLSHLVRLCSECGAPLIGNGCLARLDRPPTFSEQLSSQQQKPACRTVLIPAYESSYCALCLNRLSGRCELSRACSAGNVEPLSHRCVLHVLVALPRRCVVLQNERAYQKQAGVFQARKRVLAKKANTGIRYFKNIGLGFRTPKEAIEGQPPISHPSVHAALRALSHLYPSLRCTPSAALPRCGQTHLRLCHNQRPPSQRPPRSCVATQSTHLSVDTC